MTILSTTKMLRMRNMICAGRCFWELLLRANSLSFRRSAALLYATCALTASYGALLVAVLDRAC